MLRIQSKVVRLLEWDIVFSGFCAFTLGEKNSLYSARSGGQAHGRVSTFVNVPFVNFVNACTDSIRRMENAVGRFCHFVAAWVLSHIRPQGIRLFVT